MDNSVIARSGWLLRRVNANEWQKNWIELYRDGYLKYYESDCSPNADDIIYMPTECISIKTGLQVDCSIRPPDGSNPLCLFSVSAMGNKTWVFYGESLDDMRAWQLALEQARLLIVRSPLASNGHHSLLTHSNRHGLLQNNTLNRRIDTFPRPPNPYISMDLPPTYLSGQNGSLPYLPSFRAHHDIPSVPSPATHSISNLYSNIALDSGPSSLNYGYPQSQHLNGVQAQRYSYLPTNMPHPFLRPDGRDMNSGAATSSNPVPGMGPLVWSPFIWW